MVLFLSLSKFFKLVLYTCVSLIQPNCGDLFSQKKTKPQKPIFPKRRQVSPFGPGIGSKAEGFVPEVRELLKSSRVVESSGSDSRGS